MELEKPKRTEDSRFRPMFMGCVARDPAMARALGGLYGRELSLMAKNIFRSVVVSVKDPLCGRLLERIAQEDCAHFRLLGELILALGGSPALRTVVRTDARRCLATTGLDGDEDVRQWLQETLREKLCTVERLEELLGRSEDRVVRSLLTDLVQDEGKHAEWLRQEL